MVEIRNEILDVNKLTVEEVKKMISENPELIAQLIVDIMKDTNDEIRDLYIHNYDEKLGDMVTYLLGYAKWIELDENGDIYNEGNTCAPGSNKIFKK